MSLAFAVDERVMIPRPETEILVEFLIENLSAVRQFVVVDVGTGSGCIAVSLAHYLPQARVYATDISAAALEIAAQNAQRHNVADRVVLLEGDLLSPLPHHLEGQVQAVASNPPYIPVSQAPDLASEIRDFEPAEAVFSPGEGTVMHSRLIEEAPRWLCAGGMLAMEIAAGQAEPVRNRVAQDNRYDRVRSLSDLAGIERVVVAWRRHATG